MARVWIGNFKGPKGDKGDKGDIGPQGPKGEQGPMGLVNAEAAIEFEDYTTEGAEIPTPEEALAEMVSGKSLKGIISNIRAFFKGVVTLGMIVNNLEDVLNVEEGTVLPVGCKALQDLNVKMPKISTVDCVVETIANTPQVMEDILVEGEIPGLNAIPVVFGRWNTDASLESFSKTSGKWNIYSTASQKTRVRFYVIS